MSQMAKYIAQLPEGDWDFRTFGEIVVFACPQHQPHILQNGELKPLTRAPETSGTDGSAGC